MSMRAPTRHRPGQRGAAAIEFALLALPLAALTFGVTEFGRALHQYDTIAKTVRNAVRYQTTVAPGNTLAGRCLALTGNATNNGTNCSGTPLLPGLTLAQVSVCDASSCAATHSLQPTTRGTVNLVTVTVSGFPFTSMVPWAMPSFTVGAVSATMVQPI